MEIFETHGHQARYIFHSRTSDSDRTIHKSNLARYRNTSLNKRNNTTKTLSQQSIHFFVCNLTHTIRKRRHGSLFSFIFQIIIFRVRQTRSLKNKERCRCENKMKTGETTSLLFRRRKVLRQSLVLSVLNGRDVDWMHAPSTVMGLETCYTKKKASNSYELKYRHANKS